MARCERPRLFVTGQHPGLILAEHGMGEFPATPLGCPGMADPVIHADLVRQALYPLLDHQQLGLLIVQGDTSSALGAALAAYERGIPVAHVEAGLRSHDPASPWPEEHNRTRIDRIADLLFAPTNGNAANLRREAVGGEVHVTGNSGIDALADVVGELPSPRPRRWLPRRGFRLLVTCHRRENWDQGLLALATALETLAAAKVECDVILPPNPTVTEAMWRLMSAMKGVRLLSPISHSAMIDAMRRADLVLTDSGGMQEEGPALGIPMLVLRDRTERPEAINCGSAELVGCSDPARIARAVLSLRGDRARLAMMARPAMPFGDGRAATRIAALCLAFLAEREGQRGARCA
jgi:UDP-N-acetylglucosamine 2-epimerase (non-hydrolysing)